MEGEMSMRENENEIKARWIGDNKRKNKEINDFIALLLNL